MESSTFPVLGAELQISCFITAICDIGLPLVTPHAPKRMKRRREISWLHPYSHPSHQTKCMLSCAFPQPVKTYGAQHHAKSWNSRAELIVFHFLSFFLSFIFLFSLFFLQNSNTKVRQEPLAGVEKNLPNGVKEEMPGRKQELGRAFFFQ